LSYERMYTQCTAQLL